MDKTIEAEVAEYIYERLVKLAMPVTQMPLSFHGFIAQLDWINNHPPSSAILPYNRSEFEQAIQLLIGFEQHAKPNAQKSAWTKGTPLSRRSYANAVREHNPQYKGLCKNHTRLCEVFELLHHMPDDFIGYLQLSAVKLIRFNNDDYDEYTPILRARTFEFAIGLAGFDLMNSKNKPLRAYECNLAAYRWEQHCADHHYFTDFSLLINQAEANGIIYLIDHTTFSSA
jgi:hypothetical protein